eukprot:CCRYP_010086-RA/>CCRYP_010086-RA protein AED:0.19 eAED:0.19 QI:29/1/1/1/1/1/2/1027/309
MPAQESTKPSTKFTTDSVSETKMSKVAEHHAANDGDGAINDTIMDQVHRLKEPLSGNGESKDEPTAGGDTSMNTSNKRLFKDGNKPNDESEPMPTLPLKKARTAYFIFADEKREELKQVHKGEGVAALARATGELWSALDPTQRKVYELKAAEEREKLSRDMQRLKDAGLWPEAISGNGAEGEAGDEDLILPVARIRKICKLDPDVKGMSKESTMLIAKATELFCIKLGNECVTMAQMQNRRKLLPEDVVEVCSLKERFMFLKDDLKDLAKEQIKERREKEKEEGKSGGKTNKPDDGKSSVSLLSYFSK